MQTAGRQEEPNQVIARSSIVHMAEEEGHTKNLFGKGLIDNTRASTKNTARAHVSSLAEEDR